LPEKKQQLRGEEAFKKRNADAMRNILRGELTKKEIGFFYGISDRTLALMMKNQVDPINPNMPHAYQRFRLSDVTQVIDRRIKKEVKPTDMVNINRAKDLEQATKKKKIAIMQLEKTLVEVEEARKAHALLVKTISRWIDLLPDVCERRNLINDGKLNEFVETIRKAKEELYDEVVYEFKD